MRGICKSAGFTLLEVIIAVAIVGIMAGAIAPVAYHEINKARQDATLREMDNIKAALLDYYEDTGGFPDEDLGLAGLISDEGDPGWQGPYLDGAGRDPLSELSTDSFGNEYLYILAPRTEPEGAADLLIASPGINRHQDLGRGEPWDLEEMASHDDLVILLSAGPLNRLKRRETLRELEDIAEAARNHYRDQGRFPDGVTDLAGSYLDAGFAGEALRDDWLGDYQGEIRGAGPTRFCLWSTGPNREDEDGEGDDLFLEVSSAPLDAEPRDDEGEPQSETEREISEAQSLLDAQPALPLGGRWRGDSGIRGALGLDSSYDKDEWNKFYQVNADQRLVYSCGPDKRKQTVEDNLPQGVGPW